ncbi:MAG: hypothetical protein ACJ77K_09825 [Bacteroidia bacterium]
MKKPVIFIFLLFLACQLPAQFSPGYMGKRLVVTHSTHFFPAFGEPGLFRKKGILNVAHTAGVEFALQQHTMVSLAVQYVYTGVNYKSTEYYYNNLIPRDDPSVGPARESVLQYSFGLKKFRKNAPGPFGFYMKWEVLYRKYRVTYDPDAFVKEDDSGYGINYLPADGGVGSISFSGAGFAYSAGFQRILWDKLVVDYGLRFQIGGPLRSNTTKNNVEKYMMSNAESRYFEHQLLNFKLGIGFLAF